jgi:hypothetical protein
MANCNSVVMGGGFTDLRSGPRPVIVSGMGEWFILVAHLFVTIVKIVPVP